ncbi:hypothetical protein L484_012243 [Morus notabilis]|uniref:Uncharacterized protein n=1 Tax=Morus notabilis TaxID=981085 RepID=W9RA58_9ROSA|nr:hypothetical protein L484_012243 [Morus notabilis]
MAPPPGPYSGTSTLALVARVSAFSLGLVYGNLKLKYLQSGFRYRFLKAVNLCLVGETQQGTIGMSKALLRIDSSLLLGFVQVD